MLELVDTINTQTLSGNGIRWVYKIREFWYACVDWVPRPFDTHKPEAMAFRCSKNGVIADWDELAVSYCENAQDARDDCLGQMREKGIID